jgi:hypothetical protein
MYISVPANQIKLVDSVLRDHNLHFTSAHTPVIGGVQLVNIRDDQVAKNIFHRLKASGVSPIAITSTV